MNRKLIGIITCVLIVTMIPMAAGIPVETEPEKNNTPTTTENNPPEYEWYYLWGTIEKPEVNWGGPGAVVRFFARELHYRCDSGESGVFEPSDQIYVSARPIPFVLLLWRLVNHRIFGRFYIVGINP